jgi:AraC family transcriptional regulator, positive regulator of tynA and feaB
VVGGDACEIERSVRDTSDGADALVLCIRVSGRALVEQSGSEFIQGPGTMTLTDMARPLKHIYSTRSEAVTVTAPREALVARIGNSAAFFTRPISTSGPVAGLASEFLALAFNRLDELDESASERLGEQALDLIALAFSMERGKAVTAISSPRATALLRLKATIEARLSDPNLRLAEVAGAAGISVRYANNLLAEENLSLERYILGRRLERCRRALEDPLQAHRMIGDIAFSWGFSDLSHFNRRFRAQFGMTPGELRRTRQEQNSQ